MEFKNMEKYYHARERAANWLLSQVHADGSLENPTNLVAHCKVPYALAVAGHPLVARRVLDHLNRTFLTAEGDYADKDPDPNYGAVIKLTYIYVDCWIAEAAQRMGRFDAAQRAGRFILGFQDEASGGFRSFPEGAKGQGPMDLLSTARAGMLCLFLGKMQEAEKAGEFLLRGASEQPHPEKAICLTFSHSGSLVSSAPQGANELFHLVKTGERGQYYYYLGYPMAFLARLYQATGQERFLEGARKYFEFHEACAPDAFSSWPSGKSGWGAAILHNITGEEKYGKAAETLADFFVHTQSPDGFWFNARAFARVQDQPPASIYDATAEFVVWLTSILQEIP
jgi:hypothetical protein